MQLSFCIQLLINLAYIVYLYIIYRNIEKPALYEMKEAACGLTNTACIYNSNEARCPNNHPLVGQWMTKLASRDRLAACRMFGDEPYVW